MMAIPKSPSLAVRLIAGHTHPVNDRASWSDVWPKVFASQFMAVLAMSARLLFLRSYSASSRRAMTAQSILARRCRLNVIGVNAAAMLARRPTFALAGLVAGVVQLLISGYRSFVVLVNDAMRLARTGAARISTRIDSEVTQPASGNRINYDAAHDALDGRWKWNPTNVSAFAHRYLNFTPYRNQFQPF